MDPRPDVFICYAGPDRPLAERLHVALTKAEVRPWFDRVSLLPGDRWTAVIPANLRRARIIAVLVTPRWPVIGEHGESHYADEEIALAIERVREGGAAIVPVRLDGIGKARVPYGLRPFTGIDARSSRLAPVVDGLKRELARLDGRPEVISPPDPLAEAIHRRRDQGDAGAPREALAALDARIVAIKRGRLYTRRPSKGLTLSGRWSLTERLGRGGFAEVWKAWDGHREEFVAVKLLHAQHDDSADRRARFFRGARRMARLVHPHIVQVIEPECADQGWHFFVMEYLAGADLAAAVREKRITTEAALAALADVADGLGFAHRRELVHRDVKPSNILLAGDGTAKLSDFDLVRAADTTGGTRTGALGSFIYAAPEALTAANTADARCDVFGLGMSALFILHGKALPQTVVRWPDRVLAESDGSEAVKAVITSAIDWDLRQRPADGEAFAEALRNALAGGGGAVIRRPVQEAPRAVAAEPQPGDAMAAATTVRPPMVYIPEGMFIMGSSTDETGRDDDEAQHAVRITRPFWMSTTPVTQAQYAVVTGHNPSISSYSNDASRHPVETVSWFEAVEFCNRLSAREGLTPAYAINGTTARWNIEADGYRLPTEAEWEYACRAGTLTAYNSGETEADLARVGWYEANSGGQPHLVAQKTANAWGLHDMHGNVWEWCGDWFGHYGRSSSDHAWLADPAGPIHGPGRVVRGGCYENHAYGARSACRDWRLPVHQSRILGFRLVRAPRAPWPKVIEP